VIRNRLLSRKVKFIVGVDASNAYATARERTSYTANRGATWDNVTDRPITGITPDGCAVIVYDT
jgi:hypothetical protein